MSSEPVVLITGAAKRVGAATATYFHTRGFCVGLHYNHSIEAATDLFNTFEKKRAGSALLLQADLANTATFTSLISAIETQYGRLDVLINNASAYTPIPFSETSEMQFDHFNSTTKGAYFLTQAALPLLRKNKGTVLNLLDTQLNRFIPEHSAYFTGKGGLAALTKALAVELAPTIRVNAVAPGAILWPEHDNKTSDQQTEFLNRIPLGRLGQADEIAETLYFLATGPRYITGETITVDGGRGLV